MRSNQLSYLAIILLSYQESNLDLQSQNLSCCHYTIAQLESERKGIQFLQKSKKFCNNSLPPTGLFPDDLDLIVESKFDYG